VSAIFSIMLTSLAQVVGYLREGVLETHLHTLEKSFRPFFAQVQSITPNTLGGQTQTLMGLWTFCQDTDIVDLSGFVQHLAHIHLPFDTDNTNYPALKENIASLVIVGSKIQGALMRGSAADLKKQTDNFNIVLNRQIANPRIVKQYELDTLCEVIYRLRMRLIHDANETKNAQQQSDILERKLSQESQNLQEIVNQIRGLKSLVDTVKTHTPAQSNQVLTNLETTIEQTLDRLSTSELPQFEDARRSDPQEIIDKVSNLAYRIREWQQLETHLQNVYRSFNRYWSKLPQIPSDWSAQALTSISSWTDCRDKELPDLNSFVQNLQYIDKPFEVETPNYPKFRESIAALVNIGENIYDALINNPFRNDPFREVLSLFPWF
jgi:hypothetical protein